MRTASVEWGRTRQGNRRLGDRQQAFGLEEKVTLTQCAQFTLQIKNNRGKHYGGEGEVVRESPVFPLSTHRPLEGRNVPKD